MNSPTSFVCRFVVMADARGEDQEKNEKIIINILDRLIKIYPQPNYIVFLGDLVLESKNPKRLEARFKYFKEVFKQYYPVEILLPTVGNHDVISNVKNDTNEKIFAKVFSEFTADGFLKGYNRTTYYVDICNVRLIVLNSYHPGEREQVSGQQLTWLEHILNKTNQRKIVCLHTPAYPTGHHIDSSLDVYPQKRDRFWNVIDKNNVDLVFTGHEHNYSRRLINNIFNTGNYQFDRAVTQVVTGGAGGPLKDTFLDRRGVIVPPIPVHHYVVVDVYREHLAVTAISLEGNVIDSFYQ